VSIEITPLSRRNPPDTEGSLKDLNLLAALAALGWLVVTIVKLPAGRVHWSVLAYLLAQVTFMACGRWGACVFGPEAPDNLKYKTLYATAAILPILSMALISVRFSMEHGGRYGLVSLYVCASFAYGIAYVLNAHFSRAFGLLHATPALRNHFILSGALVCAGAATLLSLAAPSGDIEVATKTALGLLWFTEGAYRYAYAIAMIQPHLRTVARFDWVPIALALVMAVGLSRYLNSHKSEAAWIGVPQFESLLQYELGAESALPMSESGSQREVSVRSSTALEMAPDPDRHGYSEEVA
jgi:hypothetical protein